MISNLTQPQPEKSCPYIGLKNDLQTTLAYPSARNYCHLCRPAAVPDLAHQGEFCLASRYVECPAFLAKEVIPMPEDLLYHDHIYSHKRKITITLILFVLVLLLLLIFLVFTLKTGAAGKSSVSGSQPVEESSLIVAKLTDSENRIRIQQRIFSTESFRRF